jgi:hypothetical protein
MSIKKNKIRIGNEKLIWGVLSGQAKKLRNFNLKLTELIYFIGIR